MIGTYERHSALTLMFMLAGPIIWAADMLAIYGSQSSLCAFGVASTGDGVGLLRFILWGATALAALTCCVIMLWPGPIFRRLVRLPAEKPVDQFIAFAARGLAGLSFIGILFFGLVVTSLPLCGGLR